MTPLFKKLNFKEHNEICIINPPEEFGGELKVMKNETSVKSKLTDCKKANFVLTFVKTKNEIETISSELKQILEGDPVIWFAYPKKTSKKYSAEINRDSGWESLRNLGLDTVRAVAIDDDWTALRFRKQEFIKNKK